MNSILAHSSIQGAASLLHAMNDACREHEHLAAITMEGRSITYAEICERADRIAFGLQQRGVQPGDIVALLCMRSPDLIAAMLGVWRAGAAYLPIDPGYPAERIRQTLQDAAPALLLTCQHMKEDLCSDAGIDLQSVAIQSLLAHPGKPVKVLLSQNDLAYVIYTSGSTGRPKGVQVTHGNLVHLFTQIEPWFHFDREDVWTMFHSAAFDFSVFEIWGALLYGGRLVIVPHQTSRIAQDFRSLLQQERVTVLCQTPSAFQMLQAADAECADTLDALRVVVFGGEALNFRSLMPWFERYGDSRPEMVNMYGITEITVHATYRRVLRHDAETVTESLIGVPIPGSEIHLVDEALQPAEEGEMLIAGPGVAAGYLGRPELTAERFVLNPFGEGRVYRSGDLARRRPDGDLVYLGRADRQVKIHGFRIEPGEVEAAMLQCAGVRLASVCAVTHPVAGASLAAYIVCDADDFDAAAFTAHAANALPPQMRPAHFLRIDHLPLTVNGKVDRDALPSPFATGMKTQTVLQDMADTVPEKVALAWQTVLRNETIPGNDVNFFEAGGNSLLLIALKAELERLLGREIPAVWLFQFPTIDELSDRLQQEHRPDTPQTFPVAPKQSKPSTFRAFRQRKELTQ